MLEERICVECAYIIEEPYSTRNPYMCEECEDWYDEQFTQDDWADEGGKNWDE